MSQNAFETAIAEEVHKQLIKIKANAQKTAKKLKFKFNDDLFKEIVELMVVIT